MKNLIYLLVILSALGLVLFFSLEAYRQKTDLSFGELLNVGVSGYYKRVAVNRISRAAEEYRSQERKYKNFLSSSPRIERHLREYYSGKIESKTYSGSGDLLAFISDDGERYCIEIKISNTQYFCKSSLDREKEYWNNERVCAKENVRCD